MKEVAKQKNREKSCCVGDHEQDFMKSIQTVMNSDLYYYLNNMRLHNAVLPSPVMLIH